MDSIPFPNVSQQSLWLILCVVTFFALIFLAGAIVVKVRAGKRIKGLLEAYDQLSSDSSQHAEWRIGILQHVEKLEAAVEVGNGFRRQVSDLHTELSTVREANAQLTRTCNLNEVQAKEYLATIAEMRASNQTLTGVMDRLNEQVLELHKRVPLARDPKTGHFIKSKG